MNVITYAINNDGFMAFIFYDTGYVFEYIVAPLPVRSGGKVFAINCFYP